MKDALGETRVCGGKSESGEASEEATVAIQVTDSKKLPLVAGEMAEERWIPESRDGAG